MISVLAANPCKADWVKLDNAGIEKALTARVLRYDQAAQNFYADGTTLYEDQRPSWGRWKAENDQYCSVWPPSDFWACYDLEIHADGLQVRFIAKDGSSSVGKYVDLN
jgi:hypothetical protein